MVLKIYYRNHTVFGIQEVSELAAKELGLNPGTPVSYRAGDQPNNAVSLNVLTREIASTAGTSVLYTGYWISEIRSFIELTSLHVNHTIRQDWFYSV